MNAECWVTGGHGLALLTLVSSALNFEKASGQQFWINSRRVDATDIESEKTSRIAKKVSYFDSQEKICYEKNTFG